MAELNIEGKINSFIAQHPEYKGKSENVVLSAMVENGVISKAELESAKKGSAFGYGFSNDWSMGLGVERSNPVMSEAEQYSFNFLQDIVNGANSVMKERDNEKGAISWCVNSWYEVFNNKYAKSNIKEQIKDTQNDLNYLDSVARGEKTKFNYVTGKEIPISYKEAFKERRGVEFNQEAIQDCADKAQAFAVVKNATEMISSVKEKLALTTKGDVNSQMHPEQSSAAIIEAFKLCGINSKNEINNTLKDISEKYKNNSQIQKYGGDFAIEKNKQGQYEITRRDKMGYRSVATNEELQIIAKELGMRLDKEYANALGVEVPKNANAQELAQITQDTFNKYQKEYENSFEKAYGKKDLKILAEKYVEKQQQGVANIEMAINLTSMALMIVPGGAVATSGWLLKGSLALKASKGINLVDKARKGVVIAKNLQKVSQVASPFIMANMTLRPTELLEQFTSKNGMSAEEWKNWGEGVLQNSVYMGVGMGVSKLAEIGAAAYKTKALVNTLKQTGKTTEEISNLVKANPVKFPQEVVASLSKADNLAKTLQISSESALDIISTYGVNQLLGNGDLTTQDWVSSIAFAISGGALQKQFMPLSTEAKVKYLQNAFKDIKLSEQDALNILKTMDDISAGKVRVKNIDGRGGVEAETPRVDETKPTEAKPETDVKPEEVEKQSVEELIQERVAQAKDGVVDLRDIKLKDDIYASDIELKPEQAKLFTINSEKKDYSTFKKEAQAIQEILTKYLNDRGKEVLNDNIEFYGTLNIEEFFRQISRRCFDEDIKLTPEEAKFVEDYVNKYNAYNMLEIDDFSSTSLRDIYSEIKSSYMHNSVANILHDIRYAIDVSIDNFKKTEVNLDEIMKNIENACESLDIQEISYLGQVILDNSNNKDGFSKICSCDFKKLSERIINMEKIKKGLNEHPNFSQFLFDSDSEFSSHMEMLKKYQEIRNKFPNIKEELDSTVNFKNIQYIEEIFNIENIPIDDIPSIINGIFANFATKMMKFLNSNKDADMLYKEIFEENISLVKKLCADNDFPKERIKDAIGKNEYIESLVGTKLLNELAKLQYTNKDGKIKSRFSFEDISRFDKNLDVENIKELADFVLPNDDYIGSSKFKVFLNLLDVDINFIKKFSQINFTYEDGSPMPKKVIFEIIPKIASEYSGRLEDVLLTFEFSEPKVKDISEISKIFKKIKNTLESCPDLQKLKTQIVNIREQYGLDDSPMHIANKDNVWNLLFGSANYGDDAYIRVIDKNGIVYKLDKNTIEPVTLTIEGKAYNLKDKIVTNVSVEREFELSQKADNLSETDIKQIKRRVGKTTNMEIYVNKETGEQLSHQKFIESKNIKGEYEIWDYDANGNKFLIGLAEYDGNGGKHVEQHLTSLDGIATDIVYADDVKGNKFYYYKIKNNDGKILYEATKKYKIFDENHYQTFTNNDGYDIKVKENKVVITKLDNNQNLTNEVIEYNICDFTDAEYKVINAGDTRLPECKNIEEQDAIIDNICKQINKEPFSIDRKLLPMLKKLSGEEWDKLYQNRTKLITGGYNEKNNAVSFGGIISIGEEVNDYLSVFLHEAGHERFNKLDLANDEKLFAIYQKEKEKFTASFSDDLVAPIGYFLFGNNLEDPNVPIKQKNRGLNEATAESNTILNTPQEWDRISARTAILKQYFPETIAYLGHKLNETHAIETKMLKHDKLISDAQNPKHTKTIVEIGADGKKHLTAEGQEILKEQAKILHEAGLDFEDYFVQKMYDAGLGTEKTMTHRTKGVQSLYDKMSNYLLDAKNKGKTYLDALNDIRDLFGARTIMESQDFTKHPEVIKLIQSGDLTGAIKRAAELQSEPYVQKILALIDNNAKLGMKMARISNYEGADGIPYLSEEQLTYIKKYALERGMQLSYITRIEVEEAQKNGQTIEGKQVTKVRDTGYTALQIDFTDAKTGKTFEWQLRGDIINITAEIEHLVYDITTGKKVSEAHPELKELYEPVEQLLAKETMPENVLEKYHEYWTAQYKYERLKELGFDAEPPKLSDYGEFDNRLSYDNLELLHDIGEKVKNKELTINDALKEYLSKIK